jgi:isoquinoline 1-oxidoreductase beta subunit
MQRQLELDRRQFIVRALGTGAGAWLALEAPQASAVEQLDAGQPLEPVALRVSAWLTLQTDGSILVQVHKAEMGQGVLTALPMLIAEELGLPISRVTPSVARQPTNSATSAAIRPPAIRAAYARVTCRSARSAPRRVNCW